MRAANNRPGNDEIRFRIGRGRKSIRPKSPLPAITENVKLNGWTQRGFKRAPLIELSGGGAGAGASGLVISGPAVTIRGLVINGFDVFGVDVGGPNLSGQATIQGTYIGTSANGTLEKGNHNHGVLVRELASVDVGGPTPKERVVVSGNEGDGLRLEQTDVGGAASSIVGSRIGTNAAGTAALPNLGDGIHWSAPWGAVIGGPATGPGDNANNLISGNGGAGIALSFNCLPICGQQNVIDGNFIGTNLAGSAALPNGDEGITMSATGGTKIGGGVGNLISGNGSYGIYVSGAAGGSIQGNAIGSNSMLSGLLPNGGDGIHIEAGPGGFLVGGTGSAQSNLLLGNDGHGIYVGSPATQLFNNYIGVFPGHTDFGNALNGVEIAGDAQVGGTATNQPNQIAYNDGAGVGVTGDAVSAISANSIHDNGTLGIDLGDDGPTANDALDPDTGPNFLQNRPDITSVVSSGFSTEVTVELDSVAGTAMVPHGFAIQLFSNPADTCDAAGGEGAVYLGSVALATGPTGHGSAAISLPPMAAGTELAATATDTHDAVPWTSEFSPCATVPSS